MTPTPSPTLFAPYLCAAIFALAAAAPVILIMSAKPLAAFAGAILIGIMLASAVLVCRLGPYRYQDTPSAQDRVGEGNARSV